MNTFIGYNLLAVITTIIEVSLVALLIKKKVSSDNIYIFKGAYFTISGFIFQKYVFTKDKRSLSMFMKMLITHIVQTYFMIRFGKLLEHLYEIEEEKYIEKNKNLDKNKKHLYKLILKFFIISSVSFVLGWLISYYYYDAWVFKQYSQLNFVYVILQYTFISLLYLIIEYLTNKFSKKK